MQVARNFLTGYGFTFVATTCPAPARRHGDDDDHADARAAIRWSS